MTTKFRILADENIESEVVELLRTQGLHVQWLASDHPGMDDGDIPSYANRLGLIVVSYDVDFVSSIRLSHRSHSGAILVRPGHSDYQWIAASIVKTIAGNANWSGCIAVIKPSGVRYAPAE